MMSTELIATLAGSGFVDVRMFGLNAAFGLRFRKSEKQGTRPQRPAGGTGLLQPTLASTWFRSQVCAKCETAKRCHSCNVMLCHKARMSTALHMVEAAAKERARHRHVWWLWTGLEALFTDRVP